MVLAEIIHGFASHFSTQNAKLMKRPHAHIAHKGEIPWINMMLSVW
jgi:hypothetical protein